MEDYNSPEAVQGRASQEDPIVMYLIYHEGTGMGTGKACAQSGHAAVMVTLDYFALKEESIKLQKVLRDNMAYHKEAPSDELLKYKTIAPQLSIFGEWLNTSYRKVTLTANDKEWAKVKADPMYKSLVIDAGLTQIPAGTETFIGLWPMRKSQRPSCVKRLQALK